MFTKRSSEDTTFFATIKGIIGKKPKNLDLYKLAVRHSSISKDSNERLEYLGDAVLGAIVADYLFKKYPFKDEGFLTEIRSRIVKRESLNGLAEKIGLNKIVQYNFGKNVAARKSIYGNALEAFIGAVYLDKGYKFCTQFVLNHLLLPHFDLKELIENNRNFKSILIEWSQKEGKKIRFDIISEEGEKHNKEFTSVVMLDDTQVESGIGKSKKKAEQSAAEKSCMKLGLV